jgi:hypothetical protein
MFTDASLNVHWMLMECSLNLMHPPQEDVDVDVDGYLGWQSKKYWMLTDCSLKVLGVFMECSWNVH